MDTLDCLHCGRPVECSYEPCEHCGHIRFDDCQATLLRLPAEHGHDFDHDAEFLD